MKRTRHTLEQVISKLREADAMLSSGRSMAQVLQHLGVSEQTFHRWRNQFGGMKSKEAKKLKELEVEEIVRSHPRYGYRMVCGHLRLEGWPVNHKHVHRLCRRDGLRVLRKNRRKRRLGVSSNGIERRKAMHRNDVWCWDFVEDSDFLGRPLRFLTLVDEYTRECLLLEVERSMTGERIRDLIAEVIKLRGAPRHLRSDNGSEFIATKLKEFLDAAKVETLYIEPGSPWQNGYGESFNGRLREERRNSEIFADLREAKSLAAYRRHEYNHERPHSLLGYTPRAVYAARLAAAALGAPPLRSAAASEEPVLSMESTRLS